jgi:hypothetical protein
MPATPPTPSQLNFGTIIPAFLVDKVYGFITIPAFSHGGITWKEASEIVTQFNYSASKNFILREIPERPTGANFIPVISYRIGMTTFRYKLWSDGTEVINEELYNGQVIKKNFKIEIWNINGGSDTVSLDEELILTLSIKSVPTNFVSIVDIEDATSEEVSGLTNLSVAPSLPTSGLSAWYATGSGYEDTIIQSGGVVSLWADSSGNSRDIAQVTPGDKPTVVLDGGFSRLGFSGSKYIQRTGNQGFIARNIYLVAKLNPTSLPLNGVILDFGINFGYMKNDGTGDFAQVRNSAGVYNNIIGINPGTLQLVHQRSLDDPETHEVKVDNFYADSSSGTVVGLFNQVTALAITLGDDAPGNSASFTVYELIIYGTELTDAQHIEVLQYLAAKYNPGGFVLPLQFDSNIPQITN